MTDEQPGSLGRIVDASAGRFVAQLQTQAGPDTTTAAGTSVARVGAYLLAATDDRQVLCQVTDVREEGGHEDHRQLLGLLPLGEISADGAFSRGIGLHPSLGSPVFTADKLAMHSMFTASQREGLDLGRLSENPELSIYADPNVLFNRHMAILGQSGSGKSWAVSSLLQRTVAAMPRAHIVLLDLHGEYVWRNKEGKLQSTFDPEIVRHVDARSLEIPYWLLTYRELVDLLVDPNDPHASLHISYLREVLLGLRRRANESLNIGRLSVDSPVYFSLDELLESCREANEQQSDFGKRNGPLFGVFNDFLLRFQSFYNDSRYDFLLRPQKRTESIHLEGLLRDFIGLGEPKRQITVIDLSAVPNDVRPTVTSQVARLAFEFNYWNPARREFPVFLVCEEAHQYIPRRDGRQQFGTSREMERIAKEGRKYGVGLCVVSQRPTELSETVLSQCGTFICLRTTNPEDQNYIRRLMPQGEQALAGVLATLRRGEALGVGEAITLPTRFRLYPPNPPPARSDVPVATAWREGPEDLDVAGIVRRWWQQKR